MSMYLVLKALFGGVVRLLRLPSLVATSSESVLRCLRSILALLRVCLRRPRPPPAPRSQRTREHNGAEWQQNGTSPSPLLQCGPARSRTGRTEDAKRSEGFICPSMTPPLTEIVISPNSATSSTSSLHSSTSSLPLPPHPPPYHLAMAYMPHQTPQPGALSVPGSRSGSRSRPASPDMTDGAHSVRDDRHSITSHASASALRNNLRTHSRSNVSLVSSRDPSRQFTRGRRASPRPHSSADTRRSASTPRHSAVYPSSTDLHISVCAPSDTTLDRSVDDDALVLPSPESGANGDAIHHSPSPPLFPLDKEVRPIHAGDVARYDRDVLMLVFFWIASSKRGPY